MKITKHCQLRQQQRHISNSLIEIAFNCGMDKANSDKIVLDRTMIDDIQKSLRLLIEKLQNTKQL